MIQKMNHQPSATMSASSRAFLDELLRTPSPTGDEHRLQRLIRERTCDVSQTCGTDMLGNLILGIHTDRSPRIMLAGHCDQLGFIVKYINPSGYLYLDSLGGNDYGAVMAEHVTIHTRGGPVNGVIGRKPIHMQSNKEMTEIPPLTRMWVDIGARDEEEARSHVRLGDYVTLRLGVSDLLNGRIAAPGLDNKAGLFVCLETLRRCAREDLGCALYVASTVQEEIGSRGAETAAYAIDPRVAIAVDVVNATDDPAPDTPQQEVTCKLGGGAALASGPGTNPVVGRMLREAAERAGVPHQPAPSGRPASNDSKPMQLSRGGVAVGSVGIPQRNMHTQAEVCELSDLENCISLLVEFVRSVDHETDFRPLPVVNQSH
jgi:tetrahedral aminopeptidase